MTTLWMIEDLEPWPDEPKVGQVCEPTTYWVTPEMMDLPAELVCTIPARVEAIETGDRVERMAHLHDVFTTMLPAGLDATSDTMLTGCLMWDRYLWTDFRTQPAGRVLVTERVPLIQRSTRSTVEQPGWYTSSYEGPRIMHRASTIPEGHDVVAYALSVRLL